MFLKIFKNFSAKRIIKKKLVNSYSDVSDCKIKTVGILIDETDFYEKENLVKALLKSGFESENITLLAYKNKYKKKEELDYLHFSKKDVSWIGTIDKKEVHEFKTKEFDLLIGYFQEKKAPLLLVTHNSKAKFKAGFSNIDKRLFHLMIDIPQEDYAVFVDELVKYLRILNKL